MHEDIARWTSEKMTASATLKKMELLVETLTKASLKTEELDWKPTAGLMAQVWFHTVSQLYSCDNSTIIRKLLPCFVASSVSASWLATFNCLYDPNRCLQSHFFACILSLHLPTHVLWSCHMFHPDTVLSRCDKGLCPTRITIYTPGSTTQWFSLSQTFKLS